MRSASLEMSSGRRAVSSTPTAAGPRRRRERGRQGGREGGPKTMGERERERASSCLQQNKTLSKKQLQSGMCL